MSYLDTILEGVEVEWKKLGEVIKLEKGKQLNKELLSENGLYPAYNGGISFSGFTDVFNYNENTTIISQGGASAGFVNFVNTKFYANAHCYIILPKIEIVENRFIYHILKLNQERLMAKQHGAGIPALRTSEILEIPIPIPCPDNPIISLEIQKEIVRILDTFTELTAELTAELTSRKKQYNYYRETLLSFKDGDVEWKTLGEVAEIGTGNHNTQDALDNGIYTFYARGITPLKLNTYDFDETAIITAGDGVGVGKVFHWAVGKYALHQRAYRIVPNNTVSSRYIYHYIITKFYDYIVKTSVSSSVTSMRKPMFINFQVPVPSIEVQERIVSILDKFETLTTSKDEGLPKEIELRKKQYEYYRDMLLTFPKKETA